jgi:hypothetical protein
LVQLSYVITNKGGLTKKFHVLSFRELWFSAIFI